MEALSDKLLEMCANLKKKNTSQLDSLSSDDYDTKLKNYHQAMEKLVESLKKDIDQLHDKLLSNVDQYTKCENLLAEEKEKTRKLSAEVEFLKGNQKVQNVNENIHNGNPLSNPIFEEYTQANTPSISVQKAPVNTSFAQDVSPNVESFTIPNDYQLQVVPDCCKRQRTTSTSNDEEDHPHNCTFHTLLESLVGMKFSVDAHEDVPVISVIHESMGYSFKLVWLESDDWFYHVISLGMLNRDAHEWMKEDIVFSSATCPVFFQRILRVIGCY
ncbi:hypothetical protein ZOSMA_24G00490 [Zostera marina]|uniref:DUF7806 domain-containing protein n=1 Tax=Zostera marina TaxID=29655 RepID=A0A0K9PG24_ZOSMR|nr:hypothetical protein ZOSMA_24G00490 [Zostera marina]